MPALGLSELRSDPPFSGEPCLFANEARHTYPLPDQDAAMHRGRELAEPRLAHEWPPRMASQLVPFGRSGPQARLRWS
jgi:hypothetical protein